MVGKTKANFSAGLIAFLLLAICLSPYTLATDVNSCQALPSGDTYNLISDVSDTNNCFLLGNNTIFDGHGYTIYVNCTGFSYNNANFYNISVSNVNIVKNGTCSGTSAGFFGTVINDTTVDNVTITSTVSGADTLFAGIQMCGAFAPSTVPTGSSCDNIYYNDISFTGNGSGILLGTDSNTTLRNATIRNIIINSTRAIDSIYTTRGIAIEGTGDEGDFLVENVFIESNKDGIWINAENTTVNNATITSGLIGIGLGGSSNVSLQNLDITSTTNHGISIQSSSHDVTISNATIDSVGNGLHLYIIAM